VALKSTISGETMFLKEKLLIIRVQKIIRWWLLKVETRGQADGCGKSVILLKTLRHFLESPSALVGIMVLTDTDQTNEGVVVHYSSIILMGN